MPAEAELLRPVLQRPDDDAPRLDYAAWCEAQGSEGSMARGKFIRAQVELAKIGGEIQSARQRELRYLTEKLDQSHRGAWVGGLAGLVEKFAFDRGFIELVALPAPRFLEIQTQLFASAPIRHLDLSHAATVLDRILNLPGFEQIRSLDLDDNGLTDDHVAMLAKSASAGSLRWLSLAHNRLTLDAAESLAASPFLKQLQYVNFLSNPVDPVETYSLDDGNVAGVWLPPEGRQLESAHGHLPWLHRTARTIWDLVPNRFRLGPQSRSLPASR